MALDVLGKPLRELVMRIKECGHDEMQQSPKLRKNDLRHQQPWCGSKVAIMPRWRTSAIEFCIGVPVSSNLFRHENPSRLFHRADEELLIA